MTVGFLAIARPTFDVPYSAEFADAAHVLLSGAGLDVVGTSDLCMDLETVAQAARAWEDVDIEGLVILQASFADSTLVAAASASTTAPLVLWAAPEPRTGGRLRRNSFCGINLAAYVLRRAERDYRYVHADPAAPDAVQRVQRALRQPITPRPDRPSPSPALAAHERAVRVAEQLAETSIGIIGRRPDGFEPCDFDTSTARASTGVSIEAVRLDDLFERGRAADPSAVAEVTSAFKETLDLEPLSGTSIEPSVRLHIGLQAMATERGWSGLATRCWPECFTDFGGAACSAQSRLNSALGMPALCEADAYGVITSLVLQWLGDAPSFVADLVDLDTASNTAVVWHCGLAPIEMASPSTPPRATIHSNRQLPLLNEFALAAGRVTVARLSQSANDTRLVIGSGEMLDRPLPFSGTAGTIRFDTPLVDVLETIMQEGLEHHYGIVYGDLVDELYALADTLGLESVAL